MTVEDIEKAIAKLPPDQLANFASGLRSLTRRSSIRRSGAMPSRASSTGWPSKPSTICARAVRANYEAFRERVGNLADKNFALLKENPQHPSPQFKKAGRFWSARVGLRYRALAVEDDDDLVWFWIGSHAEYDAFVR